MLSARAVDVAREALEDLGEGGVGEHIAVAAIGRNVATHRFVAEVPGYPGWEWNAVVACASGSSRVTINELALLPAPDGAALKAPQWVPYSQRLRPGDLGPGDLMPPAPDDPRLTDAADAEEAVVVDAPAPRTTFLTRSGLRDAAQRWRTGDYGPTSEFAEKAALSCRSCAFYLPAGQPLGNQFGVCANEYAADGHLVHAAYGCGAHSETVVAEEGAKPTGTAFDDERPIF
ncbi:putative DUF3027 family protein [Corynebacterium uterequi]|uniref:Putative DUF3027 family protein n=1 Tax=Corynebacterium uterequi TaxID=1072256 RepID=A0A0G3HBA0_9CORY|nr:putative DUF3027 family protein [Corynebacterium uterequi]